MFAFTACSRVEIHRLTDDVFEPKPKGETIKLFEGRLQQPLREIAYIDSQPLSDRSDETRRKQLLQILEAAGELGADAVHDVRYLNQRVEGLVLDQRVPFQAYKQGRYKLYFIRGAAVVFTGDANGAETPQEPATEPPNSRGAIKAAPTPILAPLLQGSTPTR